MNKKVIALLPLRRTALQTALFIVAITIVGLARDAGQQARRADRAEAMAGRFQAQLDRDDAQTGMESLDKRHIHDLEGRLKAYETVYGKKPPMMVPVAPSAKNRLIR